MSGSKRREAKTSIQNLFFRFAGKPAEETRKKRPSPLSLRLTEEQRAELERRAGRKPLGGYVKECLFDGGGPSKPSRRRASPLKDQQALASALRALGRSELVGKISNLRRASDDGALRLTPEAEQALRQACADISAMRRDLVKALGLRAEIPS